MGRRFKSILELKICHLALGCDSGFNCPSPIEIKDLCTMVCCQSQPLPDSQESTVTRPFDRVQLKSGTNAHHGVGSVKVRFAVRFSKLLQEMRQ